MEPFHYLYKNSAIAWYRFGTGPRPVICFHGYGEDALTFEFLVKTAGDQFSFYCLDLPFHGKTDWKEGLIFQPSELQYIVEKILEENKPADKNNDLKPFLLGFSLGGRLALSLYEAIPQQVEKLVLLAPDGLKVNFWYWLSTQTWLGNKFFAFTMKHPRWFFWFVNLLHKIKLVNTSIFKFVKHYVDDGAARQLLYERWTALRKLRPHLAHIKEQVRTNATPVNIVYGKHDRIILSSVGEKFRKGIEEHCSITVIESGHYLLRQKHGAEILSALTSRPPE